MRRKKGFERPRQFKCCANTTGQGLRLRRNPFPRSRNTIETECMHRGRRIGAYEESPWAFPPNPCLGRGPLENHPALEKGRCPAAFFFLQMAPWRPTLSSRCLVVSPRPSQLYQGQKRRTDRRKSYSAVVLHWCAVNERRRRQSPGSILPQPSRCAIQCLGSLQYRLGQEHPQV